MGAYEESEKRIAAEREKQMEKIYPALFEAGSVLLIGACKGRKMFLDRLVKKVKGKRRVVDIAEVFGPYADYLRKAYLKKKKIRNLYQYDVTTHLPSGPYEIILWYHGPEHVDKAVVPGVLARLEARATKAVILGTPIGNYPQGPVDGNKHQAHVSAWEEKDFQDLGYKTDTLGVQGHGVNNLLAIKEIG